MRFMVTDLDWDRYIEELFDFDLEDIPSFPIDRMSSYEEISRIAAEAREKQRLRRSQRVEED